MNDDERFFEQFHTAPRSEFARALYQRINQPMNAQTTQTNLRRVALMFAASAALLLVLIFSIPATRAQALNLARQIGAFLIVDQTGLDSRAVDLPAESRPTALPPVPGNQAVQADSAEAAAKIAGFAVLAPAELPEGYAPKGGFSIVPNGSGKTVVTAYTNPGKDSFIVLNQYQYQPGDSYTDNVTAQEKVSDVTVRGRKGVWITGRYMTDAAQPEQGGKANLRPASWLVWDENGVAYTLMSDTLTLEQALAFAENLK